MTMHEGHRTDVVPVEIRKDRGSRKAQFVGRRARRRAWSYGMKKETVSVALPGPLAEAVIHSGAHVMEIALEGKNEKVLIQDVQYDYLQAGLEHIDLLRIDP